MKKLIISLLLLAAMTSASFATITVLGRTKTFDRYMVYGTFASVNTTGESKVITGVTIESVTGTSTSVSKQPAFSFSGKTLTIKSTNTGDGTWAAICK